MGRLLGAMRGGFVVRPSLRGNRCTHVRPFIKLLLGLLAMSILLAHDSLPAGNLVFLVTTRRALCATAPSPKSAFPGHGPSNGIGSGSVFIGVAAGGMVVLRAAGASATIRRVSPTTGGPGNASKSTPPGSSVEASPSPSEVAHESSSPVAHESSSPAAPKAVSMPDPSAPAQQNSAPGGQKEIPQEIAKSSVLNAPKQTPTLRPLPSKQKDALPVEAFAEVKAEMERAMARVEELEIVADDRDKRLRESEKRATESGREKEQALARVQELEERLGAVEARASGLESLLSGIGTSVGAALRNSEVVAGDLSLFDSALHEAAANKEIAAEIAQEKQQIVELAMGLETALSASEVRVKILEVAEARAKKLGEGLTTIFSKIGANQRGGFFSSFFGRSEDDMIRDTLAQIDDLKK